MDADPLSPILQKSNPLRLQDNVLGIAIQSPTSHRSVFARAEHTPKKGCFFRHKVEMNVVIVIIATNCHMVTSCMCVHIFNIYIYMCVCICHES